MLSGQSFATLRRSAMAVLYCAAYFIERGVINANVAGKLQSAVCWGAVPDDTVRALLSERIMEIAASDYSA